MKIPEYYIFKTIVHDMKTKLEVELQPIELDELLNEIPEIGVSIPLEEADIGFYINVFADDEPDVKAEKIYQITKDSKYNELIKCLLEYFEMRAESSETYIKRSDAIKAFAEYLMHDATTESPYASVDIEDWTELAEDILNDAPPVKSIRPKGEWQEGCDGHFRVLECSECKYQIDTVNYKYKYCPNCGADMRGEE